MNIKVWSNHLASIANAARPLKVRLVLERGNKYWILGKFANRLEQNLTDWNIQADIAETPSADVDVNHWMFYGYAWSFFFQENRRKSTRSTMAITHVDDPIKLRIVREALDQVVDVGICMSRMTAKELARQGIKSEALCYISPAHDGAVLPRRTVIGITSRVYADGRKREHLLILVAKSMPLDLFHFEIIGEGWEEVISHLRAAGATVAYYPSTDDFTQAYVYTMERIRAFDYYLYLGLDEGSMGLLDALAAGVNTIVTRQGFHLDIPGGITYGFLNATELIGIFKELRDQRQSLIDSVKDLTWEEYARQHAIVWRCLLADRLKEIEPTLHPDGDKSIRSPAHSFVDRAQLRMKFYMNAGRSDFRKLYLDRCVWELRSKLSSIKRQVKYWI
jgi:hypothetical protein